MKGESDGNMSGRRLRTRLATVRPGGTFENSPAIHRWGTGGPKPHSPVGTVEKSTTRAESVVPPGLPSRAPARLPAFKRWATFTACLQHAKHVDGFSRRGCEF